MRRGNVGCTIRGLAKCAVSRRGNGTLLRGGLCGSQLWQHREHAAATWSLSGVGTIMGMLTVKIGGGTAAGQGDSGGPGVAVVQNSSGFSFLAAGIISGGPPNPPSS
jgi:hypothetical protein